MKTLAGVRLVRAAAVGWMVLGLSFPLVWVLNGESPQPPVLVLSRESRILDPATEGSTPSGPGAVVPDFLRRKYETGVRGVFRLSSPEDVAIFVEATGVQVPSQSGWRIESEDPRGEIWRLKAGVPREVCVGRPQSGVWRGHVRYGVELTGLRLLKAQIREAWRLRSFSNWTGKAWGGGRFGGGHEVVSEEITE